jgi:tetratricopeptide (TPR) repeat protein
MNELLVVWSLWLWQACAVGIVIYTIVRVLRLKPLTRSLRAAGFILCVGSLAASAYNGKIADEAVKNSQAALYFGDSAKAAEEAKVAILANPNLRAARFIRDSALSATEIPLSDMHESSIEERSRILSAAGYAALNAGHYKKAEQYLYQATSLNANDPLSWLALARAIAKAPMTHGRVEYVPSQEEAERAIDALSQGIARHPSSKVRASALASRSVLYSRLGKFDLAERDVGELIRLEPNYDMAHYALTLIAYRQKDYPLVIDRATAGINTRTRDEIRIELLALRAAAYSATGQIQKALDDRSAALKLAGSETTLLEVYEGQYRDLQRIGDTESAAALVQEWRRRLPKTAPPQP